MSESAEQSVRDGKLDDALSQLQSAVRDKPADASLRVFLFQLLCVRGDWSRALTQLNVAGEMDSEARLMMQTYRELLQCEGFRESVFAGERAPLLFGEPPAWAAALLQALAPAAAGDGVAARSLVDAALEQAPACSGTIDDQPFEWLCDADMRLGPMLEAIINGRYYWIPMEQVSELTLSEPEDLRDLVWLPAHFRWVNEGTSIGFLPARYPGVHASVDAELALSRKTDWQDLGAEFFVGAGQKMLATDNDEYALLQSRKIRFTTP